MTDNDFSSIRGAWLRKEHPGWINVPTLIVSCVSVAVAFVPEGLPVALTASLTISANMMRKNKILCKSLKTVETLGAVSVICSDKTGTLTAVRLERELPPNLNKTIHNEPADKKMFHLEQNGCQRLLYRSRKDDC